MSQRRATTLYLDPKVARAAKIKAAVTGRSLSDIANEGIAWILRRDAEHLRIARASLKAKGKSRPYEEVLEELRRNGEI
jgi:hypothetical protein